MKRKGVVKGQAVECDEPLDLPEGQTVVIEILPAESIDLERYGIRPLPLSDYVVTSEMVNKWRDDLGI